MVLRFSIWKNPPRGYINYVIFFHEVVRYNSSNRRFFHQISTINIIHSVRYCSRIQLFSKKEKREKKISQYVAKTKIIYAKYWQTIVNIQEKFSYLILKLEFLKLLKVNRWNLFYYSRLRRPFFSCDTYTFHKTYCLRV